MALIENIFYNKKAFFHNMDKIEKYQYKCQTYTTFPDTRPDV